MKLVYRTLFTCLCFSISALTFASPTLEDYSRLPFVSQMSISPNGKRIAFRQQFDNTDRAVVYSLEEGKPTHLLDLGKIKPDHIYFVTDDKVIFKAGRERKLSGYRGVVDLTSAFVYDLKESEVRQLLVPGWGIYLGQSGLGRIVGITPDSNYALMPAYVSKSETDQNPNFSLVRTNLNKKRKPVVLYNGRNSTLDYIVGPNGEVLAEERYNDSSNRYQIISFYDKKKVIYEQESSIPPISLQGVSADYESLIVIGSHDQSDSAAYYKMSLKDGTFTGPVFVLPGADVVGPIKDINQVIQGVEYSGLTPSYEFSDLQLNTRVKALLEKLEGYSVNIVDWTPDWNSFIIYIEGSLSSGDYYLVNPKNELRYLASARDQFGEDDIHPIATFTYTSRDGLKIPTILTIPKDKIGNAKNLPAIMLPHGGPEAHDQIGFDSEAQALANQGYLVIQPQFRGSDGFGIEHTRAGYGEWGGKMQDDLTDAINVLVEKGYIDPKRVCIVGSSYGGYAALAGGAFDSDTYQCVVAINGVSDLPKMISFEKSDHGSESWIITYWKKFMTGGEDYDKVKLKEISPSYFADNFKAPVLLIHGDKDRIVDIKQSKTMYSKLKKAGKEVEFLKLKGENHHLVNQETRSEALKATIEFVNRHLQKSE